MRVRAPHPEATVSTQRLEAYTDGVFAIAATLLVLDLTTTDLGGPKSDAALVGALLSIWPGLLNFAISFLVLCLLWMLHVRQFENIVRVDGVAIWLNSARLLFIVLIPFTTSIAGEFASLAVGRMAMPVNFLVVVALGWVQWLWVSRTGSGMLSGLDERAVRMARRDGFAAVLLAILTVALSPLFGSLAFVVFALDGPLSALLNRSEREP